MLIALIIALIIINYNSWLVAEKDKKSLNHIFFQNAHLPSILLQKLSSAKGYLNTNRMGLNKLKNLKKKFFWVYHLNFWKKKFYTGTSPHQAWLESSVSRRTTCMFKNTLCASLILKLKLTCPNPRLIVCNPEWPIRYYP